MVVIVNLTRLSDMGLVSLKNGFVFAQSVLHCNVMYPSLHSMITNLYPQRL